MHREGTLRQRSTLDCARYSHPLRLRRPDQLLLLRLRPSHQRLFPPGTVAGEGVEDKTGVALRRLSTSAESRRWRDPRRGLRRRSRMQGAIEQVRLREDPAPERLARQVRDLIGSRPRRNETETSNNTLRHRSAESITVKVEERITVVTGTLHRVIITGSLMMAVIVVGILTTAVIADTRKMAVTADSLTMVVIVCNLKMAVIAVTLMIAVIAVAQTTVGRAMPATQRVADNRRTIHVTVAAL